MNKRDRAHVGRRGIYKGQGNYAGNFDHYYEGKNVYELDFKLNVDIPCFT